MAEIIYDSLIRQAKMEQKLEEQKRFIKNLIVGIQGLPDLDNKTIAKLTETNIELVKSIRIELLELVKSIRNELKNTNSSTVRKEVRRVGKA